MSADRTEERLERGASKIAEKGDWDIEDMPRRCRKWILERPFSEKEMENLRRGNIPKEMEDKWFFYMEGDTLFAHRSWTGFCIYIIQFRDNGRHKVTVNHAPDQYTYQGWREEKRKLNQLLDYWIKDPYDHYHEWISETLDLLHKNEQAKDS